jgi:hypothetical protein
MRVVHGCGAYGEDAVAITAGADDIERMGDSRRPARRRMKGDVVTRQRSERAEECVEGRGTGHQ